MACLFLRPFWVRRTGSRRIPFLKPPHLLCRYSILNYKKSKKVDVEVSKMRILKICVPLCALFSFSSFFFVVFFSVCRFVVCVCPVRGKEHSIRDYRVHGRRLTVDPWFSTVRYRGSGARALGPLKPRCSPARNSGPIPAPRLALGGSPPGGAEKSDQG